MIVVPRISGYNAGVSNPGQETLVPAGATPRRGVRFPPHVSALAFLLVMLGVGGDAAPSSQTEAWARDATGLKGSAVSGPPFSVGIARADTVPPYLAFPEPGLDDPAAYEGYQTRVYQDASGNGFQVYLKSSGRVVNLWADAANESVGFSVRDSTGKPAELA